MTSPAAVGGQEAGPADATPKLGDPLTWDQIASLGHEDAVARAIYEFRRHQVTRARTLADIALLAVAGFVSAFVFHPTLGPIVVFLLALALIARRSYGIHDWALDQIREAAPPMGRLRVVVLMLSRTNAGGCDKQMFTRLLNHAPDELSCAALGRHLQGYCPHATTQW